ncbi:MAG: hypothetical protein GWM88_07940 [Pseudomonadales bacterium]|nr:hypothetical protein [Pseudomonadales bacterium]NIX07935.1 hypothetical protein [Pseudomonadales bacterium]
MALVDWLIVLGLGGLWHGLQIIWVGGLPRQVRRGDTPTAPKGTPEAFGLFWIDQYGYIGLALALGGTVAVLAGVFIS